MIYLNNAATSYPKPEEVIMSVMSDIKSPPFHPGRAGFEMVKEDINVVCKQKLATLFNIKDSQNIVFTSGATESLNLATFGLDLLGGHVITSAIEHNSVLRPLKKLEKEEIIELSIVDCDKNGYVEPDDIAESIKHNTKLIAINHSSNVTGEVVDVKRISEIAHAKNIKVLVDASQSAGSIAIDVDSWDIDMLAFTGHKSLYGLPGIGGLYIKEGIRLKPLKVGGTGVKSELLYQPEEIPTFYEAGTPNIPGIVSLASGTDFILKTGIDEIRKRNNMLFNRIMEKIEKIPGIIFYGKKETDNRIPIFSFNFQNLSPEDTGYILGNSFIIIVRSGLHCAPLIHRALGSYPEGSVRVSLSYFNTEKEIDIFINALEDIGAAQKVSV